MSQSRERATIVFHLAVDLLWAGAMVTALAGVRILELAIETGASVLGAARCHGTAFGTRGGSTETQPLGAED